MTDRPLECSHCKKPIKVIYKEIIGNSVICTQTCADCPFLDEKLHGSLSVVASGDLSKEKMGVCCGRCHTSLADVKMGNPLGCSECYDIFSDFLIEELILNNQLSLHLRNKSFKNHLSVLHVGKTPNGTAILPSSNRLTALNEALNEALKKENYEQAAWLRDQIRALREESDDSKS